MDMEYKSVPVDLKAIDEKGEGILRFIRFHQEDKDSDITLPGFVGQQEAVLLSGHNWKSDYPPLGHGTSFEADGATNFRFQLNLADERAKAWHSWLKMGKNLQQVSYGFSPYADGQERGQKDGKSVRYLKPRPDGTPGAKLHEVSFVVVGSGNDTGVLNIKAPDVLPSVVEDQDSHRVTPEQPPEVVASEPQDVKRYTLEQLVEMVDYHVRDLTLVGTMRQKDGKKYADETLAKIDRVSKHWDVLRALVHLAPVQRDALDEEWAARHHVVTEQISRELEAVTAKEDAKNDALYQQFLERSARLDQLLYSQSS